MRKRFGIYKTPRLNKLLEFDLNPKNDIKMRVPEGHFSVGRHIGKWWASTNV